MASAAEMIAWMHPLPGTIREASGLRAHPRAVSRPSWGIVVVHNLVRRHDNAHGRFKYVCYLMLSNLAGI
jgi:hypothetical protein